VFLWLKKEAVLASETSCFFNRLDSGQRPLPRKKNHVS